MTEKSNKKSFIRPLQSKKLEESVDEALEDSKKVIEIYCRAEKLDENHVDFSIMLDWDESPTHPFEFKAETADKAQEIISLLLKETYPIHGITLRDNLSEKSFLKSILDITLMPDRKWAIGIITKTEEEMNDWSDRNRKVMRPQAG